MRNACPDGRAASRFCPLIPKASLAVALAVAIAAALSDGVSMSALAKETAPDQKAPQQAAANGQADGSLPAGIEQGPTVEGITEYRLDNGLKVLLFPDGSAPKVTVNLTVFVGSRHEGYGEAGMAHLLEHMLFKGTPNHPNVPKTLKELGADFNGTTWLDRTNYYETVPAGEENLKAVLSLEADRMVNSFVRREDLDTEMTVVRNEFERGENSPSRVLAQRMTSAAFDWHNYGQSTIGNRADIERVPIPNLQRFYKKYYRPDNAMLVVAGQFETESALREIARQFGPIANPEQPLDKTYTEEPAQDGERQVVLRRVGEVPIVGTMYHIPAGAHPDYVAMDVFERYMTAPNSGPLWEALVGTQRCSGVSGAAYALHDPGMLRFTATLNKGNDPYEVLGALLETVETAHESIDADKVEDAKVFWLKQWELSFSKTQQIAIQLSEWAAQGDWRLIFIYRDRLESTTPADVQAAAAKYLVQNNRTTGMFIPTEQSQRIEVPQIEDVSQLVANYQGREAVAAGEAFDPSPENIEERTDRTEIGGLKVALLPRKTRGEEVVLRLSLRYGDDESLKGKVTAADLMPTLMVRGTKDLAREELQRALDRNRAKLSGSGSPGTATFSIQTKREFLPEVLDLLRQVLKEPSFPADQLETLRAQAITAIEKQITDPQGLGYTRIRRELTPYDPGDVRYIPTLEEELERYQAVSIDEIRELYETFLGADHGELVVVGDFDPEQIKSTMTDLLADWRSGKPYEHIAASGDVDLSEETITISTPDKANAVYFSGTAFPMQDDHPDYPALFMGNYILGSSGLSSRLGDRVRQKEGLSYGVGSSINASSVDERTAVLIYAITNPENVPKVDKAIDEEMAKLIGEGITQDELDNARKAYLEKRRIDRSSPAAQASLLGGTMFAGRTMAFVADREEAIRDLTVDDVNAALKKWYGGSNFVTVEAGDFGGE